MYSFKNDYSEGAHPNILNALITSNFNQQTGYGEDNHTQNAIAYIKNHLSNNHVDIHLISGGTQTNLIAISSFLRSYEACIAVESGHIATHETGAIECSGHKVFTVKSKDGKITKTLIEQALDIHTDEHMVLPKLVYISNPTELGTVYSKDELETLSQFCKKRDLILYCDGARLGSALCIKDNDLTLKDICTYTDAFYIGGTKIGALLGEALVIKKEELKSNFRFSIKQRGGLLAKGRLLGIQFEELFKDNLYFKLASHSNKMAALLLEGLKEINCEFLIDSPTNQLFPILDNSLIEKLSKEFEFYIWQVIDDNKSAIRLVTSWATKEEYVHNFIKLLHS